MKSELMVSLGLSVPVYHPKTGAVIDRDYCNVSVSPAALASDDLVALRVVAAPELSSSAIEAAQDLAKRLGFQGRVKQGYYNREGQSGDFWVTVARGVSQGTSLEDVEAMLSLKS